MSQPTAQNLAVQFTKTSVKGSIHSVVVVDDEGNTVNLKNKLGATVGRFVNEPNGSTLCKVTIDKIVEKYPGKYASVVPTKDDDKKSTVSIDEL